MVRPLASVVVLLLAACGGATPPAPAPAAAPIAGPLAGEPVRSKPGARACTSGCFEAHARACAADPRVWKLEFAGPMGELFGALHVAATGITHLETKGVDLYSVDSRITLACTPRCGEAQDAVCAPFAYKSSMNIIESVAECTHTSSAADPWHGRPSRFARLTCGPIELVARYVPELVAVRDALITAGWTRHDDPGVELDGLVVEIEFKGQAIEFVAEVTEEDCAAVALPAVHEVHASLADFEAVTEVQGRIWEQEEFVGADRSDLGRVISDQVSAVCAAYARGQAR